MSNVLSRVEGILENKVYGTSYNEPPQSRVEELLMKLNTGGGTGGGGSGSIEFERSNIDFSGYF